MERIACAQDGLSSNLSATGEATTANVRFFHNLRMHSIYPNFTLSAAMSIASASTHLRMAKYDFCKFLHSAKSVGDTAHRRFTTDFDLLAIAEKMPSGYEPERLNVLIVEVNRLAYKTVEKRHWYTSLAFIAFIWDIREVIAKLCTWTKHKTFYTVRQFIGKDNKVAHLLCCYFRVTEYYFSHLRGVLAEVDSWRILNLDFKSLIWKVGITTSKDRKSVV